MTDISPSEESSSPSTPRGPDPNRPPAEFVIPGTRQDEYTDGRKVWDWKTKYPPEARTALTTEAWILSGFLVLSLFVSGFFLSVTTQSLDLPLRWMMTSAASTSASNQIPTLHIDFRLLMIFFFGCVGGTTFSIKWLIHSAAKGKWHLDRRYWRLFVPLLGGVYACVVLSLFEAGLIGTSQPT